MSLLIVSATQMEITPFLQTLSLKPPAESVLSLYSFKNLSVDVLITGVGMTAMAYYLTKTLSDNHYNFALNIGIAGSFNSNLKIGTVVNIIKENFSELGAEDGKDFLTLKDMNLAGADYIENNSVINNPVIQNLPKVSGISVNTIHGDDDNIAKLKQRLSPDVESMEGAAFLFCCKNESVPCAQIRAISNYIERRNKSRWNIPLAVKNLNTTTIQLLEEFARE